MTIAEINQQLEHDLQSENSRFPNLYPQPEKAGTLHIWPMQSPHPAHREPLPVRQAGDERTAQAEVKQRQVNIIHAPIPSAQPRFEPCSCVPEFSGFCIHCGGTIKP